jgi:hypothetical protein
MKSKNSNIIFMRKKQNLRVNKEVYWISIIATMLILSIYYIHIYLASTERIE